ncbi:MAG: amidohydrolase family protein, partial [Eubacteriales bacterium]|nr:amidohydrolase family protein [Eubacteriales bacterium]
ALIEGIKDGTVDCLSTDHAPHTPEDKAKGMAGISNIEYALQVFLQVFYENNIPLTRLLQMATTAPAAILGVQPPLLRAGSRADIILYDPDIPAVIDPDAMRSRSHNTPFGGRQVRGRVYKTILGGTLRYEYGKADC